MNTLKTIAFLAGFAVSAASLSARDVQRPEIYYPVGFALRQLTDYQINKLDGAVKLTAEQKEKMRAALEEEADKLEAIQESNLGDLTLILQQGVPVMCRTSAKILIILNEEQRKNGGIALVEERRAGFQNSLRLSLTEMWARYESAANLPMLMGELENPE